MKKKILVGFCAALFLGAGVTTAVHVTREANRASAMMLDNVEALAESEADRCPYAVLRYCGNELLMRYACSTKITEIVCLEGYCGC